MPITLYNNWRIEVLEAVHSWPNRYVISGATLGDGTFDPIVNNVQLVDGAAWVLDAQHLPPGGEWTSSDMQQEVVTGKEHVFLHLLVGAEDPLPTEDFRDIRFSCIFTGGRMIDIPYRPFAVRTSDLMQMPDGLFEARLGTYYMGVRIKNQWGMPFTASNVVDITPENRVALAEQGVQVLDDWSEEELNMLGQVHTEQGMVIGPLLPGRSRTVYFKVDVANARADKQTVEFICRNIDGMSDPENIGRKATQHIFISKIEYDSDNNDYIIDMPQGKLSLHVDEVAIDESGLRNSLRKAREEEGQGPNKPEKHDAEALREQLLRLLRGQHVDLCEIQRLLSCYCLSGDKNDAGRAAIDPYYLIFTKLGIRIEPKAPFSGQFGEIPYDDPWWKVPLALIAALLALLGGSEEAAQSAYEDEDLVIGKLHDFEKHQLDAALCKLDTSRELRFLNVLDAQSDEENQVPVEQDNLDGFVSISGNYMTEEEICILIAEAEETGDMGPLRVFKSGARTGTTFAQIADWSGGWCRCDVPREAECDDPACEVKVRFDDPERSTLFFRVAEGEDENNLISNRGDSGSVWIHFDTKRPIALNHSGKRDANTATGSLIQYVAERFNITF